MRVLTFNIQQLPWPLGREHRLRAAEATIRRAAAEVVILQEVLSSAAARMLSRLADTWPQQTPRVGESGRAAQRWHTVHGRRRPVAVNGGIAVLSRWPIVEQHQLLFASTAFPTADYFSNTGAALLRIATPDRPLWVVGTHLQADDPLISQARAHRVRMAQLGEIRDLVARRAPADEPVVLGGDLNIERWSGQSRPDAHGRTELHQAEAAVNGTLLTTPHGQYTFDAATNPLAAKSVAATYRDTVDYLGILHDNGRQRLTLDEPHLVPFEGDIPASDHYPVLATLS